MSPAIERLGKQYSNLLRQAEEAHDAGQHPTAHRLEEQAATIERQLAASGLDPSDFIDHHEWARQRQKNPRYREPVPSNEAWFEQSQSLINDILDGKFNP